MSNKFRRARKDKYAAFEMLLSPIEQEYLYIKCCR